MPFKTPDNFNTRSKGGHSPEFRDPKNLKVDGVELIPVQDDTVEVPPEGTGFGSWDDLKKSL